MNPIDVKVVTTWEKQGFVVLARITGYSGYGITQASLSSIQLSIYDVTQSQAQLVHSDTLTISSVVFDTYQTSDPRWTIDSTGYNFRYTVTTSSYSQGNHSYQLQFLFTPLSGDSFPLVVKNSTRNLL